MPRTPEQIAADDALTKAIARVIEAYDGDGRPWYPAEYVVVTARHRFNDDGDTVTTVGLIHRDGEVPLHRVLGLLDYGTTVTRAQVPGAPEEE